MLASNPGEVPPAHRAFASENDLLEVRHVEGRRAVTPAPGSAEAGVASREGRARIRSAVTRSEDAFVGRRKRVTEPDQRRADGAHTSALERRGFYLAGDLEEVLTTSSLERGSYGALELDVDVTREGVYEAVTRGLEEHASVSELAYAIRDYGGDGSVDLGVCCGDRSRDVREGSVHSGLDHPHVVVSIVHAVGCGWIGDD